MSLQQWLPPAPDGVFARNGFALQTDLVGPGYAELACALEGFQAEFLGLTRDLWTRDFPIPGDALSHFSRQWEYPYAWSNLTDVPAGRVLDAGSGITFFPFLVACAGHEVTCCDSDEGLGLGERFEAAAGATGVPVAFRSASLTDLPFPDGHFDAVTCLSVLEHVPPDMYPAIVDSMAAVLRPGGRLVLTVDVSLRRDTQMLMEDLAAMLSLMAPAFELSFPLDLRRPSSLLTSDSCLTAASSWRLPWPWRPRPGELPRAIDHADGHPHFRSLAVFGMTARRRGEQQ